MPAHWPSPVKGVNNTFSIRVPARPNPFSRRVAGESFLDRLPQCHSLIYLLRSGKPFVNTLLACGEDACWTRAIFRRVWECRSRGLPPDPRWITGCLGPDP